ncbi:hypothetical protein CDD80_6471 [Ophiocordyceps camponoti-rufipedis]|uniref:DUF7053 domain-containing protein n=1 Tax=Ophiocordyceps camponoti-rufipedis TaxID=2004952 RepID=A0A2C5YQD4_9HYPO|nr:hypothetical protein CDD80_6471 [Ophiocordyceps camponoti-rufipedis]
MVLRRKVAYTVVTPIPGFIPRQLALDILHAHSEVITLNPLVLSHRPVPAPRTAATDEYYSTWYEIVERIQCLPGVGGTISFVGCFHDMPWGLQTHVYAPMGIDLRNRYRIAGNQPGIEPPDAHRELGLDAPADGLYLREDIEIRCNFALTSFVRAQLKAASKEMIRRFIKKAELLDAGILQAMMDRGRLQTVNPNDRSRPLPPSSLLLSTRMPSSPSPSSPGLVHHSSVHKSLPPTPAVVELPADSCQPSTPTPYRTVSAPSTVPSTAPDDSDDARWSHGRLSPSSPVGTHRTSVGSVLSAGAQPSPGFPRLSFAAELPAPDETKEMAAT